MKKLITALAALCFCLPAFASSLEYPSIMRSGKALGMGDAYYTMGEDQYTLFYNPAGLARIENKRWSLLSLQLEWNNNSEDTYSDIEDTDFNNEDEVADFLRDIIGDYQHVGASIFPAYYKKNFSVGVFAGVQATTLASNRVYPATDLDAVVDMGVTAGVSRSFMKDRLDAGLSVMLLNRKSINKTYTAADIARADFDEIIEDDIKSGTGILANAGVIFNITPKDKSDMRVGAAVNNIGTTDMGDAEDVDTTATVSFAVSPSFGELKTDFVADLRDISKSYDEDDDYAKRLNLGARAQWKMLSARAGLHQGYASFGIGADLKYIGIDYSFYQEEMGAYAGQQEDERHIVTISAGF
ncbi:hypothetical protein [Limisalsivibrio acetivorans]|uniref:hypothetical protein n=1 Tax=Limisalsivibrio acetivorans TaxID=1304888 RepID=UPI0003B7928E|nr:hypothetical protein [Limisalsivibrio acetivorans]